METEKSLKTKFGEPILNSDKLRQLLIQGKNISHTNVELDDDILLYRKHQGSLLKSKATFYDTVDDVDVDEFHSQRSSEWLIPQVYKDINVLDWLLAKCTSQIEIDRVNEEYKMFEDRDLVSLLKFFIFLIDHMRSKKHVWGVGRGSSVASFILFLIGVHRVNSIKFGLDIKDYLK